jgi:Ca2+-binding RTX toxin-like protein
VVRGLGGDDRLSGNNLGPGMLTLEGGDGDDSLFDTEGCFGGCGPEYEGHGTFEGGAGDDTFGGIPGGYTFDGGDGNDGIAYDFTYGVDDRYVGVHVDLSMGLVWVNESKCPGGQGCAADKLISIENADGGLGEDLLIGDDGANILRGFDHDDRLSGGAGDDVLDGGKGFDVLDGGPGANRCTEGEDTTNCQD